MRSATGLLYTGLLALVLLCAAAPTVALVGQFKDTPIQAGDMEGRRAPEEFACEWKTAGLVIGLGEKAEFRVRNAEDPDYYVDPWTVWDPVEVRREFEKDGQPAYPSAIETWQVEYQERVGEAIRYRYDFYVRCLFQDPGGYTVKCFIDDIQGIPQADDDEIHKQMCANVGFDVRVVKVFSTDGSSIQEGSPGGGTIGMEVEWTAGLKPEFIAEHTCAFRSGPQHNYQWRTMEEEITCDFPNRGKYCWNTTPADCHDGNPNQCRPLACNDNEGWNQIARLVWGGHEVSDSEPIYLQNLTIDGASPEYLIYDPDAQSPQNTITYKLKDGWDIYPPGQETTVRVEILNSDGTPVKTEEVIKTASRNGTQYPYVWDGKNDAGELMPKGIYVYRITGTQTTHPGTVLDATAHVDTDCEKSWWEIGNTEAQILAYNVSAKTGTMGVSFWAGPPGDYPLGLELNAEGDYRPKLEVYDPDLSQVAEARVAGHLPVHQRIEFPDVQVPFTKGGDYIFLVSPWESEYLDYCPDKAHRVKPLLPKNTRTTIKEVLVIIDPGHGGIDPGTLGSHHEHDNQPHHDRYPGWAEADANEWVANALSDELENHLMCTHTWWGALAPSILLYWNRMYDVEILERPAEKKTGTLSRANAANRILKARKPKYAAFISLHCNAGAAYWPATDSRFTQAWYHTGITDSEAMAGALADKLCSLDWPLDWDFDVTRSYSVSDAATSDRMALLGYLANKTTRQTHKMPCNLVEMVVLTTPEEEDWILQADVRTAFAHYIHCAYCNFEFSPIKL